MRPQTIHSLLVSWLLLPACLLLTSCATAFNGVLPAPQTEQESEWHFARVVFEIAPTTGHVPSPIALETFRKRIHENKICHREHVVFMIRPEVVLDTFTGIWDIDALQKYEKERRVVFDPEPNDRELFVFVPYIAGVWRDPGGQIKHLGGIQYEDTAFAIISSGREREASVLLHEFGHLLGLVDESGTYATPDADHDWHCDNERCAMYWSSPSGGADFDRACKRELARLLEARGK